MEIRGTAAGASLAGAREAAERRKVEEAARDFEALLVTELLRAARAGGAGGWLGEEDAAAESALGLGEEQLARAVAAGGGLGLARLVLDGLEEAGARSTRSSSRTPRHTPGPA